jgi:SAM-dependent methyltransferase
MAHQQQRDFYQRIKNKHPRFFSDVKILDIGSLDINGSTKDLFDHPFYYVGIDLAAGKNVDVICPGHLYDSGFLFDVVTSSECFEHDMYYSRTLQNMVRLLRSGGLMAFTCATEGRHEHGTLRTSPEDAPFLLGIDEKWANYYKNLSEDDIRTVIDINNTFSEFGFETEEETRDLYFWGIKK